MKLLFILFNLIFMLSYATRYSSGQRTINTVQVGDNKYFFSDTTPYSPKLNWFLAYQYCRNIGMDLMSQQTQEESQAMFDYLDENGKSSYGYWTSANQLGSPMWIWMTTGQPLNTTFHYWSQNGPPLTKSQDGCMKLQNKIWSAINCMEDQAFICQLTRCYYFDYTVTNQINSSQGRNNTPPKLSLSATSSTNQRKLQPNPATQRKPIISNSNFVQKPTRKQFPNERTNEPKSIINPNAKIMVPTNNQNSHSAGLSQHLPNHHVPKPEGARLAQNSFLNHVKQNEIIPDEIPSLSLDLTLPHAGPTKGRSGGGVSEINASNNNFGARRFQRKEEFSWAFA